MTTGGEDQGPAWRLTNPTIDLAIRLGFLALLAYWSFLVIAPFITIGLWSALLAVALHPLYEWLARYVSPRLAAALVTLVSLLIVVGPVTWLAFGMVSGIGSVVAELNAGQLAVPLPPDTVKAWPFIGEGLHQLWSFAANNIGAAITKAAPLLKPVGAKLLDIAQSALVGLLELLVAIVIAGFLFARGPQIADALSLRGKELAQLAGATIRSVSRGVIGIALLQAFLGGAAFLVAGVPAAGVLAFVALLLGILQIGPSVLFVPVIIWSWTAMLPMQALLFTAYMIPVSLIDNVLRPFLMARGLTTPMPVIMVGVFGGMIAYGILGLFFGPVVLSVAWVVLVAWMQGYAIGGGDPPYPSDHQNGRSVPGPN
jgi:predicted PurR-regulated permease PerM